jgi:hypothetical protein
MTYAFFKFSSSVRKCAASAHVMNDVTAMPCTPGIPVVRMPLSKQHHAAGADLMLASGQTCEWWERYTICVEVL